MKILFLLLTFLCPVLSNAQEEISSKKAENHLNAAAAYYNNQNFVKALNESQKALSVSLIRNDEYHLALSYNLIGTIYNEFAQTKRALTFYTKGLAYANKVDNDTLRLWLNSNIGNVYYYNDLDVNEGIWYYTKALKFAEKTKDSLQITFIRLNIANAYFEINKTDKGLDFIQPLAKYIEQEENAESKITYFDLLARYHSIKGQNEEAERLFAKAIYLAEKENLSSQLYDIYKNTSVHYTNVKNYAEGDKYNNLARQFEIDLQATEKLDTIEQLATQIELDEYKFQFERIELKNDLQNQKIRESKILIIAFTVILTVLLFLIYSLSRNVKVRKKTNAQLFFANQKLSEAKNKAEENSILKSQFISTVSHELRTPLYGVVGLTNVILEENKDVVNLENLNSLRFSAQYLLALVNDLLEINKAEEKKIILKEVPFNLRKELQIINNSLLFMADGNNNKLFVNIDDEVPEIIVGDVLRLSQIIMNLISNALKFTEKGEVKIEAKLRNISESHCGIEFIVSDTGIGIKLEDQERIFDKFVQVERKQGDYQGTGLGLPIVKNLVELFGGTIVVESEESKGTTFKFAIEFEYLNAPISVKVAEVKQNRMEKELKILVVEDNKINQVVTKKIIERRNHPCTIAESGYEAIDLLKTTLFDIILMDISMPVIDGYDTSKMIRELGIDTPIIALTAFEREEVEAKAMEFGISAVITKPFNPDILFDAIEKLITV